MMQLMFSAFRLSLSVLWRYLIVLPFLVVLCGLIATVSSIVPLIGIAIAAGAMTFAILIGMRTAFQAMGDYNDLDFAQLVKASLVFGLAQIVLGLLVGLVAIAAFAAAALLTPEIAPLLRNPRVNWLTIMAFFETSPITQMISIGSIVLFQAISALIAVPMAGAAHSATQQNPGSDIWRGLGASFLPICAILLISYGIGIQSGMYDGLFQVWLFLIQMAITAFAGDTIIWATAGQIAWMIACFVYLIWTSCLYFAAAALGWKKHLDDRQQAITAVKKPVDTDTLRAMREGREAAR
jgi:hypothetical protein